MFATMRLLVLAALLTLAVVSSDYSIISCPDTSSCQCEHGVLGKLYLWCSRTSSRITFHTMLEPGNMLSFQCSSMSRMDYSLLSGLHVGPTPRVSFMFCPLPDMPLYQMLDSIGASGVESLVFEHSNLSDTLESSLLAGLNNLTTLTLHSNGITTLPAGMFQDMHVLKYLDLKNNALQLPVHVFDSLSNILTLDLGGNQMRTLEVGIFRNLSRLYRLDLWGNNLHNLTQDVFTGLSSLHFLDLSSNKLTSVSADLFANMPQLREVSLQNNNFTSLPDGLFSFTKYLTKLGLHDNRQQLQHVPPGLLANLTSLLEVYLSQCGITHLAEDIFWGSSAISNISLNGNLLTSLPADMFRDTVGLRNLRLGNNRLESLPDGVFSRLRNLLVLELDHNRLTNVSMGLMKGLTQLESLNLEHNWLQHIAVNAFWHVPGLKQLTLSHNRLSLRGTESYAGEVQSVLNACLELEELYVRNNSITTIFSDWVLNMLNLRNLDLSHNHISRLELPEDIQFLSGDITVDLTYNNISVIDLQYLELVALGQKNDQSLPNRRILLEQNPLMCDCEVYDLLRYLEDRLEPEAHNMFEIIPGNLSCAGPLELRGTAVKQLSSLKIQCLLPRLGDCPHPCACYERPADSALIVECSGLNLSHSPANLPDPVQFKMNVLSPKRIKLNQTELRLTGNRIATLPPTTAPGYDRVTRLYLSHNNISTLEAEQIPPHLQVLELDHNNMMGLSASTVQALSNRTGLYRLTLHANPWQCDYSVRGMLNFLLEHFTQVAYLSNITCGDNSGRSLTKLTYNDLCSVYNTAVLSANIIVALLGITVGILVPIYY